MNDTTMQQTKGTIPPEQLAEQIRVLISHGGTIGDIYDYTDQDYELLYTLGHGFYSQGRYADAMKAFGYLVVHNHLERRYVSAYAASLQMIKRYEDALCYFSLASAMDMTDPVPTFHSAECLIALGRVEEAQQALGFVLRQCVESRHGALKDRAEAMQKLISSKKGAGHE